MSASNVSDIIFIQRYHSYYQPSFLNSVRYKSNPTKYDKEIKASEFARCHGKSNLLNYLTRNKAVDKTSINDVKEAGDLRERGMSESSIMSYMKDRPGSTGLFDETGDLSKSDVKEMRQFLQGSKSTIFECVLSFSDDYAVNVGLDKIKAFEMLKETMPEYFKGMNLDPKKMKWFAAFHTNTENPHCHIVFLEKEVHRSKTKDGSPKYLSGYDFKLADIARMKSLVRSSAGKSLQMSDHRTSLLKQAGDLTKTSEYGLFNYLKKLVGDKRQYARLDKFQQSRFKMFLDHLKDNSEPFRNDFKAFLGDVKTKQAIINARYERMGVAPDKMPENAKTFEHRVIGDFSQRIFNTILHTITQFDRGRGSDNPGWDFEPSEDEKEQFQKDFAMSPRRIRSAERLRVFDRKLLNIIPEVHRSKHSLVNYMVMASSLNRGTKSDSIPTDCSSMIAWREIEEEFERLERLGKENQK